MLGPIFVREWLTLPRRPQHYAVRTVYYGLLLVLGLTAWQATVGWSRRATLGDVARFGRLLFQVFAYFQLVFLLFFSALSAAVAVSQEKDRRTFIVLLTTDLRDHEIVLGKLVGALLQIALLLLGSVALLALGLLLGGVSGEQVVYAAIILSATCLAAGSLGCLVALWREQTFQALAWIVMCLVLYFCLVHVVGQWVAIVPVWLDPFLCLHSVLEPLTGADARVPPPVVLALFMVCGSVLMNAWTIRRLRAWNTSAEPARKRVDEEELGKEPVRSPGGAVVSRRIWNNPILWREVRTRAYGRRPLLIKVAYAVVIGLIGYYALAPLASSASREPFAAAYGLLPVAILSLFLVSAQAVTAVTTERDLGALDLLLVTDLTPREFIFGKLLGIAYNTKEYLLPPLLLACVYAYCGWLATPPRGHEGLLVGRNIQALGCVLGTIILMQTFVTILGLHIGLRTEQGRRAVTHTLGTVFFLSVGTLTCIWVIAISGRFDVQWTSFVLFIAASVAGLWWVLNGERPSLALNVASWACPFAVLYSVMNVLIGKLGSEESSDPFMPFLVLGVVFSFAIAAMLVPLLSEFDVALGRTTGGGE